MLYFCQVCVQDFCEELEYWGLNDLHLEPCCQHTYYRARWLLPRKDAVNILYIEALSKNGTFKVQQYLAPFKRT